MNKLSPTANWQLCRRLRLKAGVRLAADYKNSDLVRTDE
jgi:hypothetical protein